MAKVLPSGAFEILSGKEKRMDFAGLWQKSVTEYLKTANKPVAFQTMLRAVFSLWLLTGFLLCARQVQRLCHHFHAV